jgi:hypothetical protein
METKLKNETVSPTVSRRVAGIWFIWSVWFGGGKSQDTLSHKIDRLQYFDARRVRAAKEN